MSFVNSSQNAIHIAVKLKPFKIIPEMTRVVAVATIRHEIVLPITSLLVDACFLSRKSQILSCK